MGRYTTFLMMMAMGAMLANGCRPALPDGSPDDDDGPDDDGTGAGTGTEADGIGTDADGDGWTVEAGDCDDGDTDVHPGADERACNGVDDDCDGLELGELMVPSSFRRSWTPSTSRVMATSSAWIRASTRRT
jgi:hypothetical protein